MLQGREGGNNALYAFNTWPSATSEMCSTPKQQENKMKEPKEALPRRKCIYSIQIGQLASDAEDMHINPNANTQFLYE